MEVTRRNFLLMSSVFLFSVARCSTPEVEPATKVDDSKITDNSEPAVGE